MIIVKLIGGLGNQMFQYALGLSVAETTKQKLKLDISSLIDNYPERTFTARNYELDIFVDDIDTAKESELDIYKCLPNNLLDSVKQKVKRKILKPHYYFEKEHTIFDAKVFDVIGNTYFDGYWQNQKYLLPNETLIRNKLQFRSFPIGLNAELAFQIKNQISVSIHVRRGDYVTNSQANEFHGMCSITYYQQAVKIIQKHASSIYLYIFSDDPEWVRENLHFDVPTTYVSHNYGKNSYEDMRLMSMCTHNIIANSSFSWWGAWLNINPEKVVIAPKQWYADKMNEYIDVLPDNWITL